MSKIQITEDGSHTLFSEMAGQTYHSSHGAVQESRHIFISQLGSQRSTVNGQQTNVITPSATLVPQKQGDNMVRSFSFECNEQGDNMKERISVLEIGFGTGLNALLTACWAKENGVRVEYSTIELYPLDEEVYRQLNYGSLLGDEELFVKLHEAKWDAGLVRVTENFAIRKCKSDIVEWLDCQQSTVNSQQTTDPSACGSSPNLGEQLNGQRTGLYDVVYFDAFSPDAQPELWSEEVFRNVYALMKEGGVLTTYCAKGDVRRAMIAAGFRVEKLPGPPGKRHILRAER